MASRFDLCFDLNPVVRLINTLVQFCSEMLNRYLDLNSGFALVVKTLPDGTFSSIWVNREEIRTQRFMNTHVQFCGEHACSVSCRFCVLDTGSALV